MALGKLTHKRYQQGSTALGPWRPARPCFISADFGNTQSTGPLHLTNKGTAVLDS